MKKICEFSILILVIILVIGCSKKNNINNEMNDDNVNIITLSDEDKLIVGTVHNDTVIFDYDLDQLAIIDNNNKNYEIMNKYIYSKDLDDTNHIYDMSGNELYQTKGIVLSVSKSGYALVKKKIKDQLLFEIINIYTDKIVKKYKLNNIDNDVLRYSLYKDYFIYEEGNSLDLYDAKNDQLYSQYPVNKEYIEKEKIILENETLPYLDNSGKILSLKNNLYFENNAIYDKNKKELKKIDGLKYIYYYDDKIFVYSNDLISVLDVNLNSLFEDKVTNTYFKDIAKYDDSINNIINFDSFNQDLNIKITNRAIYVINKKGNVYNITILDNETLEKMKKYSFKIDDKNSIKITQNGIIVSDKNTNILYYEKGKIKLPSGKIKFYSDSIISLENNNEEIIYNLDKKIKLILK